MTPTTQRPSYHGVPLAFLNFSLFYFYISTFTSSGCLGMCITHTFIYMYLYVPFEHTRMHTCACAHTHTHPFKLHVSVELFCFACLFSGPARKPIQGCHPKRENLSADSLKFSIPLWPGGGRMWPLGFVTALGLGVSVSVGGCLWGNFLFTLSKHRRGPCGPWRLLYFPPMEAEVGRGALLDLVPLLVPGGMGGPSYLTVVGALSSLRDPGPFSGEKNLFPAPQGGGSRL